VDSIRLSEPATESGAGLRVEKRGLSWIEEKKVIFFPCQGWQRGSWSEHRKSQGDLGAIWGKRYCIFGRKEGKRARWMGLLIMWFPTE